jgi:hypothetical protein
MPNAKEGFIMSDTLFLQFYNKMNTYYDLCNGFSDTFDLCKKRGDFYWTEHEVERPKWYREDTYENRELPISRGTVYVSAIYMNHLYQSYVWAKQYPDIQFTVGGPVAAEKTICDGAWDPVYTTLENPDQLPPNLTITGRSVEDIFGVPNFSGKWKLEVPEFVPPDGKIYFSYTLDNRCYWSKCIFCNIALHAGDAFRKRKYMNFEFKDMPHPGKKIVRLNTGSMTPQYIRDVLPSLPVRDDLEYRLFMRPSRGEIDAFREVLENNGTIPKMVLGFGAEFPSNRMLKHLDKGFTTDDILDFLSLCRRHHIDINANFILGWDNFVEDDIRELENFMGDMETGAITTLQVRWLFAHPHTKIHDTYYGKPVRLGPFYEGFRTDVSDEQREFARQAVEIMKNYSNAKEYQFQGMSYISEYLPKN